MRVCPLCMRELLASEVACPHDGGVPFGAPSVEAPGAGTAAATGADTVPRARRLGFADVDTSSLGSGRAEPPLADQLEPGLLLGKAYRVERLIGHGGMGAVYEVEHLRLHKRFAAKVLRREYAQDTTALARFEREAVAASRIHHPNIVEVVNMDETAEGRVFIVEELLLGFDLAQFVRGGPPPMALALTIGVTVARALEAAHAAGIVHRDLKPANIFLARRGGQVQVKVLDFGISKIVGETDRALTDTGGFVGTPLYMAPEQAREGGAIDARTDVYALGVILYELLTGAPPFQSKNPVDVALKHVMEAPEPLATRNAAVPATVADVVMHALAKAPEDRPADMATFAAALTHAAEQAAITLGPVPAPSATTRATPPPRTPAPVNSPAPMNSSAAMNSSATDARALASTSDAADSQDELRAGPRRWRPATVLAGVVAAAGLALLAYAGATSSEAPPAPTPPRTAASGTEAPAVAPAPAASRAPASATPSITTTTRAAPVTVSRAPAPAVTTTPAHASTARAVRPKSTPTPTPTPNDLPEAR